MLEKAANKMITNRKRKRSQVDAINARKFKVVPKKINPFEVHQNREKFDVLNRHTNHSRGQPLISRQQALDKRKQTLGVEYKQKNKSNMFQDSRRAGFKVPKEARESIYNLSDSMQLTHRGQTLAEVGNFDYIPDDDDEMSDDDGIRLNGEVLNLKSRLPSNEDFFFFSKVHRSCEFRGR